MSASWRSLALTAVVAVLAGGLACWATSTWLMRDQTPPSLHDAIHERIELTSDQETRITRLESEFAGEREALEAELREANSELVEAISANRGDTPEVQAAVDHFHVAMGDLQKATLGHVFDMRAVLTPEQAEVFDAAVVESLQGGRD